MVPQSQLKMSNDSNKQLRNKKYNTIFSDSTSFRAQNQAFQSRQTFCNCINRFMNPEKHTKNSKQQPTFSI